MNRRQVLELLAAASLSRFAISAAAHAEDEILQLDCTDLLARIRNGSLRAEQVCSRFLQQYDRQRSLNVITWIDRSKVLSCARDVDRARDKGAELPALAGLPILVKDNIDTVGLPTSAGTASLKQHFPRANAPVVERLLQQGAIVLGKANMHELALGVTSSNPTFGFVRNPYNPDLIPGGSSGGSAAAIAARIVPAALGTDTGGSVRIPAAFCGIVGFRPSTYPRKLYSQQGVVPLTRDLDTIGPMGRSVADVATLHATIVGERCVHPKSLEKVRIGVPRLAYWDDLDPDVERIAEVALARLRDQGAVLVEIDLGKVKDAAWRILSTLISAAISDLENFLLTEVPSVSLRDLTRQIASRDVRAAVARVGPAGPAPDLLSARGAGRDATCAAYRALFQRHGIQALVFPTEVILPPPIRAMGDDPDEKIELNGYVVSKVRTLLRNTVPAAALGAPALSLPAGLTSDGLPVALEFDGLPGNDSALLALGMAVEAAIGRLPAPTSVT
jgi:Asp-tRNA(Asn)/Glu-tRNA(Gln) amidotransferase A subunit family amidase